MKTPSDKNLINNVSPAADTPAALGEPTFPDYSDSILNLSCSVLKHYGITPKHNTLPQVDAILSKNPKHVAVILLDGLGVNILQKHLPPSAFLRQSLLKEYSSVFPPTTTASTTSFLSGLSPIEHGWLGWDVYFEQEGKTVCCFKNTLQQTQTPAADYHVAFKHLFYKDIIAQTNESQNAKAYGIFPFGPNAVTSLTEWAATIEKTCQTDETTFTYAYWEHPDLQLHSDGTNAASVTEKIRELNDCLQDLCGKVKDTVFFVTADHGHIDIANEDIEETYPDLAQMLVRPTSIEARAISFYVKDEYKTAFPQFFAEKFGKDYVLFSKEEVLRQNLFGDGKPHKNLTGIGDFIGAAVGTRTLLWNKNSNHFRSHHAGLTKNEMRIPLICFEA